MPKPRKSDQVRCRHFMWRLKLRNHVWYADGRSNTPNPGRHSLGTADKDEAMSLLPELDRVRAEELGIVPRTDRPKELVNPLPMAEGRKLYETYISRPPVTGGVRASTAKRYRTVFDKFLQFAAAKGISIWNVVTVETLTAYAADLQAKDYAYKSQLNELTVLKQAIKWLVQQGHLTDMKPIELKLRKAECEPAYCYRAEEIHAIVELCRSNPDLAWLANVTIGLACTGLRIAEFASIRWADIDFETGRLSLTDETARVVRGDRKRRQTKSSRSRSFPIHPDLLLVLKSMPRIDGYVFHGSRNGRLKPDTVRRVLVREVIMPLTAKYPTPSGEKGFEHGRLHSFRHAFCSTCANSGVPERMVMDWLGHNDSAMIRTYYHLHDAESRRRMNALDFLGGAGGRSDGGDQGVFDKEVPGRAIPGS